MDRKSQFSKSFSTPTLIATRFQAQTDRAKAKENNFDVEFNQTIDPVLSNFKQGMLPELRLASKTMTTEIGEIDEISESTKNGLNKTLTQIVKTTATTQIIKKSQLKKFQDQQLSLGELLSNDGHKKAFVADNFFKQNLTNGANIEEGSSFNRTTTMRASIKKGNQTSVLEQSDDEQLTKAEVLKRKVSKSLIMQIREKEKDEQIKNANKSVKKTLIDLEKLAVNDKEMIELQRKTIYVQQLELQAMEKKMRILQRNLLAATNASKFMQDEVTLIREDKVILEIQNKNIIEMTQQENEKNKEEIAQLKSANAALQQFIRKINNDNSKTSKANAKILNQLMNTKAQTFNDAEAQTIHFNENQVEQTEFQLVQNLNKIYKNHYKKKARLPLTEEEDKIINLTRKAPKNKDSNNFFENNLSPSLRDTIGLGAKGGTHVNVGIQTDQKHAHPQYKALNQKMKRILQVLETKEKIIERLKDQVQQAEKTQAILIEESNQRLEQDHKKIMSLVLKEIDSKQQKIVTQLKNQKQELKDQKQEVNEQLIDTHLKLEESKKNFFRAQKLIQRMTGVSFEKQVEVFFDLEKLLGIEKEINQNNQISLQLTNQLTNNTSQYYLQRETGSKIQDSENIQIDQLDKTVIKTGSDFFQNTLLTQLSAASQEVLDAKRNSIDKNYVQIKNKKCIWTNEMPNQTDEFGNPINPYERHEIQIGTDEIQESEESQIVFSKTVLEEDQMAPKLNTSQLEDQPEKIQDQSPFKAISPSLQNSQKKSTFSKVQIMTPRSNSIATLNASMQALNKDIIDIKFNQSRNYKNDDKISFDNNKKSKLNNSKAIPKIQKQNSYSYQKSQMISNDRLESRNQSLAALISAKSKSPDAPTIQLQEFQELQTTVKQLEDELLLKKQQLEDQTQINQDLKFELRDSSAKAEDLISKYTFQVEDLQRYIRELQEKLYFNNAREEIEKAKFVSIFHYICEFQMLETNFIVFSFITVTSFITYIRWTQETDRNYLMLNLSQQDDLMKKLMEVEKEQKEYYMWSESEQKKAKQEFIAQQKISIEKGQQIDQFKLMVENMNKGFNIQFASQQKEISFLVSQIEEIKLLFEEQLKKEKKYLAESMDYVSGDIARLHVHVSCLGCDQIKPESLMLLCGHNICQTCLQQYSKTDHPRSSVRCEVCCIETKVTHLSISLPNRAICEEMTDLKMRVEHLLNYDIIGDTMVKELIRKTSNSFKSQLKNEDQ